MPTKITLSQKEKKDIAVSVMQQLQATENVAEAIEVEV